MGENESLTVDVRVICATHRHLDQMVDEGDFREDLMFRINTFEIHLPALRQRSEDIPQLASHLLRRLRPGVRPNDELFTPEALHVLTEHTWPGNVRELANVVEHAAILSDTGPIDVADLPNKLESRRLRATASSTTTGSSLKASADSHQTLREIETQVIYQTLERLGGNKPKAAEELGISLKTLYNKLNQANGSLEKSA